jgi:hypothetical protein
VSRDVFEKDPSGLHFADDPGDVRPKVAGIVGPFALSRLGKRLTWVSGEDGVNCAAPRGAVEQLEVIPDRGGVQISGALPGDEGAAGIGFDFDIAGGGKARLGKAKTHVKSAAACTEADADPGR